MIQFLKNRIKSIKYALNGVCQFYHSEIHAKIHIIFAFITIALAFILEINRIEWVFIVFAIGIVFITEMLNTSIEKLVDLISPEYNKKAGIIKDVAAGAVLMASVVSVIIGSIIFLKHTTC